MRIIRIKIVTHSFEAHMSVITGLFRVRVSHTAEYTIPQDLTVTCDATSIREEEKVNQILGELGLLCEKTELYRRERLPIPSAKLPARAA